MSFKKRGSCHCRAVKFEVNVPVEITEVRRCNCSLCSRKGALMTSVLLADLTIIEGEENLSLYQWNTNTAKHYFCKICGIYTHHKRRSVPTEFGVNVACIEGVDSFKFTDIIIGNGAIQ